MALAAPDPPVVAPAAGEPGARGSLAPDIYERANAPALLAGLTAAHFFNDFCLGIAAPMIPSLETKFGMGLGAVAGIVILTALFGNFAQPVAGRFMDLSATARVLLLTPLLAGLSLLVGLATAPWQARLLFILSGIAIGTFHPYALVLAQRTLPRRPALATSIFISFGFLGVSFGSMVSGVWLEHRGFAGFHGLYLIGAAVVGLLVLVGVPRQRLADYRSPSPPAEPSGPRSSTTGGIGFGWLYLMGLLVAIEGGTLLFFVPKLFKDLYGSEGLGGQANFLFGVLGGLSSYGLAYLADRGNPYRIALWVQVAAIAPLVGFFEFEAAGAKMAMMGLMGVTVGGTFPVMVSLAREAHGLTLGLRLAIMLGGVWGVASLVNLAVAQLPGHGFDLQASMSVIRFLPLVLIPIMAVAARQADGRLAEAAAA